MRKLLMVAAAAAMLVGCGRAPSGGATDRDGGAGAAAAAFTVHRVPLSGERRGDYLLVDSRSNRLFVTHSAMVHILTLDTLAPVAQVTGLQTAHGVALAGGHGFVTDGGRNAVVEFDPATGRTLKSIPVGEKPDSILYDAASNRVVAFDGESDAVNLIDPAAGVALLPSSCRAAPNPAKATARSACGSTRRRRTPSP